MEGDFNSGNERTSNSASNFELFECKQSEAKTPSVSFSKDRLRPLVYDQLIKKNKTCSETKCENHLRGLHARSNSENQRSYLDDIEEGSGTEVTETPVPFEKLYLLRMILIFLLKMIPVHQFQK
uniref:Uncharacterized protein n=1 Tax=Glossina pallidipes TaxID=7398 RepID=A0A1B0AEI5_GLOPL